MILKILSDENIIKAAKSEIARTNCFTGSIVEGRAIAQAALDDAIEQFREWGEEACPHYVGGKFRVKRECLKCWQALQSKGTQQVASPLSDIEGIKKQVKEDMIAEGWRLSVPYYPPVNLGDVAGQAARDERARIEEYLGIEGQGKLDGLKSGE